VAWEHVLHHYEVEKELANRLRRASKEERRSLYRVVYDEIPRQIKNHPLIQRAADAAARDRVATSRRKLLERFVEPRTRFLEIGAGDCALAMAMAALVHKVFAFDVSPSLLLGSTSPANCEFCIFEGLEIPLASGSIDVAYSNDVMEHLHPEDALDQLRSICDILRPGGVYVCITPNRLSGPHDISRHFDKIATGFHLREYTVAELTQVMRSAGFSRVRIFLSYRGQILSPLISPAIIVSYERLLERLPWRARRRMARLLAAVRFVAIR
jgi:SAM-dependent methyltransferase